MALSMKLSLLLVIVLLYSFKMIPPAECSSRVGWLDNKAAATEINIRRQYYQEMFNSFKSKSKRGGSDKYEDMVEWDLRKVPAGPDPLHHNGGSPKKPRKP